MGVIGALGGVSVTAVVGLGTAGLTRSWNVSDRNLERNDARAATRRDAYVRYLSACDALESSLLAVCLDPAWREAHQALDATQLLIAHREEERATWDELDVALYTAEIISGDAVCVAIRRDYDSLTSTLRDVAGTTDPAALDAASEDNPRVALMDAIRAELTEELGGLKPAATDAAASDSATPRE